MRVQAASALKRRAYLEIARRRRSSPLRWLNRLANAYTRAFSNLNYDLHTNGERRVLEHLADATSTPCLFDVGANVGDWTKLAIRLMPQSQVHCFEIVPDTFRLLEAELRGHARVVLNEVGLGTFDGEVTVEVYAGDSSRASTVLISNEPRPHIPARVIRGDEYCKAQGIDHIDFLKIDTEGGDYDVLQGFATMIAKNSIDLVQFEYGLWSIWTKHTLKDHYEFLESHDYRVGKIYPTYVDFKSYDPARDEDLRGPNYLAVRTSCTHLIHALA